jgi:ABC-type transporter Mla subunit MlaD
MPVELGIIAKLQSGLEQLNACAAEAFLALGGALQSVSAQAREVAAISKEAVTLGTSGKSDESMQQLQLILDGASEVQALGLVSREKLHEVFVHLQECEGPLSHLVNLPSVLGTVGMLYRIEASRLEGGSINVSTLTADMKNMAETIAKHVATMATEADRLTHLVKDGTKHMDQAEEQERKHASDLIGSTSAVIGSFRARQKAAGQAALRIDQQYGDMRLASDRIVMSLQSEDMARQRIEHVQEAVAHISTDSSAVLHAADAAVLILQRSQLLSTRELLLTSVNSVRDGLRSLGRRLDTLTAASSSWASQTNERGESFSTDVKAKLNSLSSNFGNYLNSARGVVATVDSVIPGLAGMTSAVYEVEEIHASIRVLALNAGIKTARSGKKAVAIGSLADELHSIARQSDGDTHALLKSMREMRQPLQDMEQRELTSLSSKMMQWDSAEIAAEMNSLIEPVIEAGQKLSDMLSELSEKTAKLRADLQDSLAIVERARMVLETFDRVVKTLDRDLVRMGYKPEDAIAHGSKTARLSTLYSMQSERDVHQQLLAGAKSTAQAALLKPVQEELGSNIELF